MKDSQVQLVQKMVDAYNKKHAIYHGQRLFVSRLSNDSLELIRGEMIGSPDTVTEAINYMAECAKNNALRQVESLRASLVSIAEEWVSCDEE